MAKKLPARPNLDHLRRQAKTLLAELRADPAQAHLRLADAQFLVARRSGFASWPALSRHVELLRGLEGEWQFAALEIDAAAVPGSMLGESRLLIDGDRFQMASPEANYDGEFTIDVEQEPAHIDIEFVEGPEAGQWSYGIFALDGDQLTICLGLVGAKRPSAFKTTKGSGHALEKLRRASAARPAGVTGGDRGKARDAAHVASGPSVASDTGAGAFDFPVTPALERLAGEWAAVDLTRDGTPMPAEWLSFGSRVATGNEVKVVFGGQTMVHAKVRLDESSTPVGVDYLNLSGGAKGKISLGIMDWTGDDCRFLIAAPGQPRPKDFSTLAAKGWTYSRWRRR